MHKVCGQTMIIKTRRFLYKIYKPFQNRFISYLFKELEWVYYRTKWLILYGTTDFFDGIAIETSSYCQLRCSICPNSVSERGLKKNEKLLPHPIVVSLLLQLRKIKFRGGISFHRFNEPLTDKRLLTFIMIARQCCPKAKINIASNGLLLTQEYYNKQKTAGVDEIIVTEYTDKDLHRVEGVIYRKLTIDDALYNRGGLIKIKKLGKLPCQSAFSNGISIDTEGNVLKCCNDFFSSEPFGNINNQLLLDIWHGKKYKEERKRLRKQKFISTLCKECIK